VIEAQSVSKKFGSHYAVRNASFTIGSGERVAFLGRSGAGKTTLMNILTGYVSATDGSVLVDGVDILKKPLQVRQKIGYLPHQAPLYLHMTPFEYLSFMCEVKRVPKARRIECIADAAERLQLKDKQNTLNKKLSKADRVRTALAGALCADPDILICDEPTAGLEPEEITNIRSAIHGIQKTLIIATSNIQEVTALCSKVVIMHEGQIVAQDALENFSHAAGGKRRVSVRLAAGRATGLALLKNIDGVDAVECIGTKEAGTFDYVVDSYDKDMRADIFKCAAKAGIVLLGLKPQSVTLEDVFYQLTCQSGGMAV
jgi:ABC-2 type transport system ATP-binding protein